MVSIFFCTRPPFVSIITRVVPARYLASSIFLEHSPFRPKSLAKGFPYVYSGVEIDRVFAAVRLCTMKHAAVCGVLAAKGGSYVDTDQQ